MKKFNILFLLMFVWACDPCADVTCVNGTCEEGNCICDAGWTGESCEIDKCASVVCDHGTCYDGLCQCDDGWTGVLCDECETDCGAHGECDNAGECDCDAGWTGELCDEEIQTDLCTNTCEYANDGECDDGGPGYDWVACVCGTDCNDCGSRTAAECAVAADAALAVYTLMSSFPCNTQLIDVYIAEDEEDELDYLGSIDSYCPDDPDCYDGCTVTTELHHGTYYIYAECNDGDVYWDGYVEIVEGFCNLVPLPEPGKKTFSVIPKIFRK